MVCAKVYLSRMAMYLKDTSHILTLQTSTYLGMYFVRNIVCPFGNRSFHAIGYYLRVKSIGPKFHHFKFTINFVVTGINNTRFRIRQIIWRSLHFSFGPRSKKCQSDNYVVWLSASLIWIQSFCVSFFYKCYLMHILINTRYCIK